MICALHHWVAEILHPGVVAQVGVEKIAYNNGYTIGDRNKNGLPVSR
jgi:hypothetical protein